VKDERNRLAELEAALAELLKERREVEKTGCFSDKELAQKQARLEELNQRLRILTSERDKLKARLRTRPLHDQRQPR